MENGGVEHILLFGIVNATIGRRNDGDQITGGTMGQENYDEAIQACNYCADACDFCASACLAEDNVKMMARCIALDIDCAAICRLTAGAIARGSEIAPDICRVCAEACRRCSEECRKHDVEHCQECADACEACAEECDKIASVIA